MGGVGWGVGGLDTMACVDFLTPEKLTNSIPKDIQLIIFLNSH